MVGDGAFVSPESVPLLVYNFRYYARRGWRHQGGEVDKKTAYPQPFSLHIFIGPVVLRPRTHHAEKTI